MEATVAIGDPFQCTEMKIVGTSVRCEAAFTTEADRDTHIKQFHPASLRASDAVGGLREFEAAAEEQRERWRKRTQMTTEQAKAVEDAVLEELRRDREERDRREHERTLPKRKVREGVLDHPKPKPDVGAPHKPTRRVVRT
jgi:hypothetical protein